MLEYFYPSMTCTKVIDQMKDGPSFSGLHSLPEDISGWSGELWAGRDNLSQFLSYLNSPFLLNSGRKVEIVRCRPFFLHVESGDSHWLQLMKRLGNIETKIDEMQEEIAKNGTSEVDVHLLFRDFTEVDAYSIYRNLRFGISFFSEEILNFLVCLQL